jgi:fatty-acyl-CoA synthase
VANVAVVAMPHEKWGETPCAFIEIIDGKNASRDELHDWCRQNLAGFKVPSDFRFESIPKTSTGKIQKYALRQRIAVGGDPD